MGIITKELVKEAIELVRPTAEKILNTEGTTWGPKWVEGLIKVPGLEDEISFFLGEVTEWNSSWGKETFFNEIAAKKLQMAKREGMNTSILVAIKPWKLEKGEYLFSGGAVRDGICVAVSGAKGRTDEALAEMVISAIVMLAFLETDKRLKEEQEQI